MEYLLLQSDMTYKRFATTFKKLNSYNLDKYELMDVEDDYYVKEDFGLYVNDEERAISHAIKMLKRISAASLTSREKYVDILFGDLDRLVCWCVGKEKECDKILRMVFEVSVEYGYLEYILEFVNRYYEERYLSFVEDGYNCLALDYHELYIKLGDYALFENANVNLALKFYTLADIDWYLLRCRTTRTEFKISDEKRSRVLRWHDTVTFMDEVYFGSVTRSEHYLETRKERGFWEQFIQFQNRKRNEAMESIAEAAELCMRHLTECASAEATRRGMLRELCVAMHGVRRDSIFSTICALSQDVTNKQELYAKKVIRVLEEFYEGKQGILGDYARHTEDKNLDKHIFLLCEAVNLVESIKKQLLVHEMKQDMAYYTSIRTLMYMLPDKSGITDTSGRLSVMHIAYMNDPNEGKILEKYLFSEKQALLVEENRKSAEFPFVFMKCFTSLVDDLPMWEMYGDHAEGCCIVLDWEKTRNKMGCDVTAPLYRVCYVKKNGTKYSVRKGDNKGICNISKLQSELEGLSRIAQKLISSQGAYQVLMEFIKDIAYLFKNSDYAHEQEMRILYHQNPDGHEMCHTEGEFPRLFVKTDFYVCMKEIIMGPKCSNLVEQVPYIQELLYKLSQETGMPIPCITASAIEYM